MIAHCQLIEVIAFVGSIIFLAFIAKIVIFGVGNIGKDNE